MKIFLSILFLITYNLFAQKSNRIANYEITVSLNPKTKILLGSELLKWTNTSKKSINELQFHLYLNAFKDENSTFMKESGGQLRGNKIEKNEIRNFGNIELNSLKIRNGENLLPKIKFIQPDDLNEKDKTVISVALSKPIAPNESITLDINFTAKLPKIFARTGWSKGDYFLTGQWFPKIGVLEENGEWNCHQFHAHSEFFADFGVYNVKITVPENYIIGSSGIKISEKKNKNSSKTHHYLAEDVHDFAFTASPHFKVFRKIHKGIILDAYMQPEHSAQVERYFESVINAINYLEKNIGKYPYKTLTMVDPPLAALGSGGMEYPTLITCGSYWGIGKWGKLAEVVTIHEFIHQYFQGMLASNEFEESWLDEGFTQYIEGKIMDESYPNGSQINILGFTLNDLASSRAGYVSLTNPEISQIYRKSWEYPSGTYGVLTYQKTATWLKTLEGLLGEKAMHEVLKTYFERWKFKHPTAQSFIDVVNELINKRTDGKNMDWFFKQVLFEAPICDYAVTNLKNETIKNGTSGNFTVQRLGDMIMPTDIKIVFADKTSQIIHWDGKDKAKKFQLKKKIKFVKIDPETKNWMDLNLINNSLSTQDHPLFATKYATKMLFWVQQLFFLFGGFG